MEVYYGINTETGIILSGQPKDYIFKPSPNLSTTSKQSGTTGIKLSRLATLTALSPQIIPLVVYQLALDQNDKTASWDLTAPTYLTFSKMKIPLGCRSCAPPSSAAGRYAMLSPTGPNTASEFPATARQAYIPSYETLVNFGESIILHVMLQFANDIKVQIEPNAVSRASGIGRCVLFWYELLHELVWGCKTRGQTWVSEDVYNRWEGWFQGGSGGGGAPRYRGEGA
ncbi:LOW QUALITY PROTEIN: hypothetical protein QC761_602320 [Podospora bellae-mahoneyi]|uniref:Uncharacterized protein n=1 Tax=Podospora bellae-mahoneyi TaxID=2093777 RepID=A0ABR0F9V3_9PEZI|nr:LOW QUALITY PROTEIN: hypothetical protein QC761_602320 [Podospora bellae-mahoneyi]